MTTMDNRAAKSAADAPMMQVRKVKATGSNGALGVQTVPASLEVSQGVASAKAVLAYPRYQVSVEEYVTFRRQGFLLVRGLVPPEDVRQLREHSDEVIQGKLEIPGIVSPPPDATARDRERHYLRIHMLHRVLEIHERFLLHPRILDVLEALIGPDVMAMQSMFFLKYPGGDGQGYHQDSYYIPTVPDTLCGAWLAVDRADLGNGCMWFTPGSQHEPIYPTTGREHANHGDTLADLAVVENVSNTDDEVNTLSHIGQGKYPGEEVPAIADPGDVIFFGGHILHRSHRNTSDTRFRRSFVGHYANARSFTMWGYGQGEGKPTNHIHILARGSTHLPFGQPRFGTACAANTPALRGAAADGSVSMMASMPQAGTMTSVVMDPERNDPRAHDHDE